MTSLCVFAAALAFQQAPVLDTIYATPELRDFVGRVATAVAEPPAALRGYHARVETELSFVRMEADGRETVLQLEQVASDLFWRRDGGLLQELIGYRAQTLGATFSGLSFFEVPWLVPALYGDRLDLVRTSAAERGETGRVLHRRALHPFSPRRDEVYRFTGGDTVDIIQLPGRRIPIVRIHVEPRAAPARPTLLFQGDVDVDATRLHIVRMQGRLIPTGRARNPLSLIAQGALYVRFENAEYDEAYWLPREQRFEVQVVTRLGEGRTIFRTISRFLDIGTNDDAAIARAPDPAQHPYGIVRASATMGVLSQHDDWRTAMGDLTTLADARDFDSYGPAMLRPPDGPRLSFGTRYFSQILRFNTVEGAFTGGGLTLEFGPAAPGMHLRAHAGYAWSEEEARGGAELARRRGDWEHIVRAERLLAHTNDFTYDLDAEPAITPLFSAEDFDFLDRRQAGLVTRTRGARLHAWRFEVARAEDRNVQRTVGLDQPPDQIRLNRPAAEGAFWLGRAEWRRNPATGALSVQPGLGLRLAWEGAVGELEWQRAEVGLSWRTVAGPFTLAARGDAGMVLADAPPPQALLELGTSTALAGFGTKEFTGDRAALARTAIMYTLPIFTSPIRFGSLWVPAPAPAPSVGVQAGWTEASADALATMQPLGWTDSDGVRAAIDLRLRFFGGSVSAGAARPLEPDGQWRFVWSVAGGL